MKFELFKLKPHSADFYLMRTILLLLLASLLLFSACDSEAEKKEATQFFLRGNQKFKEKENYEAIKWYNEAILKQPEFSDAYFNRGLVYQSLEKNEEAMADFVKAFELDSKFSAALFKQVELLQNQEKYPEAVVQAKKLVEAFPDSSAFWSLQGDILLQQSEYSQALSSYDRALVLNPQAVETLINKGVVYQELNQIDLAEATFLKALATGKYKDLIYFILGYLEIQRQQWARAEAWVKKALAIDPKNPLYLKNMEKITAKSTLE
jgi:tetratricopeptide (TPR) repeat protein